MSKKHEKEAREILDLDDDYEFWQSDAAEGIVEAYHDAIDNQNIRGAMQAAWSWCKGEYGE